MGRQYGHGRGEDEGFQVALQQSGRLVLDRILITNMKIFSGPRAAICEIKIISMY